jgi:endogenous inhibitor of DNA gyrase (YacG/DUF329 family)
MIQARCPICDRPLDAEDRADLPDFPFCSPRCRLIDLGRWLGEAYRIPAPDDGGAASDEDELDVP